MREKMKHANGEMFTECDKWYENRFAYCQHSENRDHVKFAEART